MPQVHFFTIVLNGMPFLKYHIDVISRLPNVWHWHIVEGLADHTGDTAWAVAWGGRLDAAFHRSGLSIDGTTEYIDELHAAYPQNITVYRPPTGQIWPGKLAMVNAPLPHIATDAILWEIDSDELWSLNQLIDGIALFEECPSHMSAMYWADYFVGPRLLTTPRGGYANNPGQDWQRTWRYHPGDIWKTHEPPCLFRPGYGPLVQAAFTHAETADRGLVFQHYSYCTLQQLLFKESYYGFSGAVDSWLRLQSAEAYPVFLRDYFRWVSDGTQVQTAEFLGVRPIATQSWDIHFLDRHNYANSVWSFEYD